MKRKIAVIMMSLILAAGSAVIASADIGVLESPAFTVVTGVYGVSYYEEYDEYYKADGTLPGGITFYVWHDFDGVLWGTTDPKVGGEDSEKFVYVMGSDTLSESTVIPPDEGTDLGQTETKVTSEELNVRTGPGTGFKSLKMLPQGAEVRYDHTLNNGLTWAYVTDGDVSGWACADYLRTPDPGPDTTAAGSSGSSEAVSSDSSDGSDSGSSDSFEGSRVAGIILICVGSAILIAIIAAYVLKRRPSGR